MRQHPHLNQRDYFQEWNCISCYYLLCAACKNEELRAMSRPEFTNKDVWKVWKTCIYCELLYEPQVINLFGIWAKKHGDKFDLWKRQQTYVVLNNNFIVLTPNLKATNPSSGGENVLHAGFWYNRKKKNHWIIHRGSVQLEGMFQKRISCSLLTPGFIAGNLTLSVHRKL